MCLLMCFAYVLTITHACLRTPLEPSEFPDRSLKREMIGDVFRIVSTKASEKRRFVRSQRKEASQRLSGKSFSIPLHRRTEGAPEAVERVREKALAERLEWEDAHLGGFRKIYPSPDRAYMREKFLPGQSTLR